MGAYFFKGGSDHLVAHAVSRYVCPLPDEYQCTCSWNRVISRHNAISRFLERGDPEDGSYDVPGKNSEAELGAKSPQPWKNVS